MSESSDNRLIKDIPSDWEAIKLKRVVKIVTGNTPPKSQENNYAEEGVPWVKPDNLISDFVISNPKEKISEEGMKTARLIPEKSALVCCIGSVGKVSINTECCTTNQQINSIVFDQPDLLDNEFGLYVTLAAKEEYIKHSNKVVVSILNKTDQGSIKVPKPPLSKQKIIAKFLKHKTLSIDALISDKEKLIALLEEKRQAIITEAVTKGLDPDVKMKDSGVEWIGEIPFNWNVIQIKWLTSVKRGASPRPIDDPKYFDEFGKFGWVRISDVTKSNKYLLNTEQKLSKLGSDKSVKLKKGDLFLSIAGSVGKPCITNINCCIHDGFVYFPEFKENTDYLYYIFETKKPYQGLGKLGTQLNLNTDTVGKIKIPLPSRETQERIVEYIEKSTKEIDELLTQYSQSVRLLKEYRQALIYEAVTGKIDVQEKLKETEQEEVSSS